MNQQTAKELFSRENNAGAGYAPYTDTVKDSTVDAAIEAAVEEDDWEVDYRPENSDEIAVLTNADGDTMLIGDAHGAWAVVIERTK